MKVLQISIEVNSGSVGRIAEQIGQEVIDHGWESFITYARNNRPSSSNVIKIGNRFDVYYHVLKTRIFDNHAFESKSATQALCKTIDKINPDIIHLHHLHGYYINIDVLFNFLKKLAKPVVWTFHDCWSYTGHCAYYDFVNCQRWQTECHNCPQTSQYPKSLLMDRSKQNFYDKMNLFTSLTDLTIVAVSNWLANETRKSFFKDANIVAIQNGIDIDTFHPVDSRSKINSLYSTENKKIILGVASTWEERKGLNFFIQLSTVLNAGHFQIIIVGLSKKQIISLPPSIIGVMRTESVNELAEYYSAADVFVNPTLEEALGLTNLEAMACGTPVITFNSGGSPETISAETGLVVSKANLNELMLAINTITTKAKKFYAKNCRERVEMYFNKDIQNKQYTNLYQKLYLKQNIAKITS